MGEGISQAASQLILRGLTYIRTQAYARRYIVRPILYL